jgi:hypothetical protein
MSYLADYPTENTEANKNKRSDQHHHSGSHFLIRINSRPFISKLLSDVGDVSNEEKKI